MSLEEANSNGWRGTNQGHILKTTEFWYNSGNGIDSLGFAAAPGGYRHYSYGAYVDAGYNSDYWTSSPATNPNHGISRLLYNNQNGILRGTQTKAMVVPFAASSRRPTFASTRTATAFALRMKSAAAPTRRPATSTPRPPTTTNRAFPIKKPAQAATMVTTTPSTTPGMRRRARAPAPRPSPRTAPALAKAR